jgi:hypothetical protein
MPVDFPFSGYEDVHKQLIKIAAAHKSERRAFGMGWNGVADRYRGMSEADVQFTDLVKKTASPVPDERYAQDFAFFSFFVNAVSKKFFEIEFLAECS